jgi:TPR repeat protein
MKAAEQGHSGAQFDLGDCYQNGDGVEWDRVEAFEWFMQAAEQGHIGAQCTLDCCYLYGDGVEQDVE